jgi:hypothetical protein
LRSQLDDLQELYDSAKLNENGALMEKLSGSIQKLSKQVKDHEEYERETLPRREVVRLMAEVGGLVGDQIKAYVPQPDVSDLMIEDFYEKMQAIVKRLGGE